MPRPSYRAACAWIALNDNSGNGDSPREIAEYVTTALVSDLFGKDAETIARAVVRVRKAQGIEVGRNVDYR